MPSGEYHKPSETKHQTQTNAHIPAFGPRFQLPTVASVAKEKGQISKDAQATQLSTYESETYTHLQLKFKEGKVQSSQERLLRNPALIAGRCELSRGVVL